MSQKKLEGLDKAIADYNSAVELFWQSMANLCEIQSEIDIRTIIDWREIEDKERKIATTYVQHLYIDASHRFDHGNVPIASWLRAVERMAKKSFRYSEKVVVIEKFPRKKSPTQEDKDMWLMSMNAQIGTYIGNDVELVWKKKNSTDV